jgi:hypothetical protein
VFNQNNGVNYQQQHAVLASSERREERERERERRGKGKRN